MTRLAACAALAAVALAAGQSVAMPTAIPVEVPMDEYGQAKTYQDTDIPTSTSTAAPESPQQWFEGFSRAVQKQLQLQENLMRQLVRDIQEYLTEAFGWNESDSSALARVNTMLDMISKRMAVTRDAANEVSTTETEPQAVRDATRNFMKEVRVQDIVVDALWASLRGVQTSAWMSGVSSTIDERDVLAVANRAAEEFLARMYHNLRAAGVAEEDIVKYVPRTPADPSSSEPRNMGKKGRSYGYGHGYGCGYSYPLYSYGCPYSSCGYSYPFYASTWGYPSPLAWGYPSHSSFYWRRLGAAACPDCAPAPAPEPEFIIPPTAFRGLQEEAMMGTPYANPMMGTPMMGTPYANPMMASPYTTPMMGASNTNPTMATPYTNPTMATPYTNPTMGTPYTNPTMGTPYTNSMGTPYTNSMGAPYTNSMGTPYTNPTMGAPYTNPTMATPYTNPAMGAPYTNPTMGGPYTTPMAGQAYPAYPAAAAAGQRRSMGPTQGPMGRMGTSGSQYNSPAGYTGGYRGLSAFEAPEFFEPPMGIPSFGFE
uniref:59 kDa gametocyte protein n=1 Tax=Eimeria tenella TaxID=5802 RepID=A0A2P1M9F5_EIMTE|nr:59 kDa gametocyte protein precursor [Eimeria tenella]